MENIVINITIARDAQTIGIAILGIYILMIYLLLKGN